MDSSLGSTETEVGAGRFRIGCGTKEMLLCKTPNVFIILKSQNRWVYRKPDEMVVCLGFLGAEWKPELIVRLAKAE